tara:strand:+ start:466 stop:606 length:141 start_codon:yes stop_codon:yes gene_type:complete
MGNLRTHSDIFFCEREGRERSLKINLSIVFLKKKNIIKIKKKRRIE